MSSNQVLSNYEIIKEIGQGGFSKVYLGKVKETGKQVAIKVISKSASMQEVIKEMQIQREFESPYIVNIYVK